MADQPVATVIVSYQVDTGTGQPVVAVNPPVVMVRPGQSIHFHRADAHPGKMRLTFKDNAFFDCDNGEFATTGAFREGDGDVRVKTIPRRTTYHCELLDASGRTIAQSPKDAGGAVEPVKG
jgi:hypothetical protein